MSYLCPVCGFGMEHEPKNYHICPSCGTEFGLHDQNATIDELRTAWIRTGPRWWSKTDPKPENWSPFLQLANLKFAATVAPIFVSTSATTSEGVRVSSISAPGAVPYRVEPTRGYFDWAAREWASSEDKQPALGRR